LLESREQDASNDATLRHGRHGVSVLSPGSRACDGGNNVPVPRKPAGSDDPRPFPVRSPMSTQRSSQIFTWAEFQSQGIACPMSSRAFIHPRQIVPLGLAQMGGTMTLCQACRLESCLESRLTLSRAHVTLSIEVLPRPPPRPDLIERDSRFTTIQHSTTANPSPIMSNITQGVKEFFKGSHKPDSTEVSIDHFGRSFSR
jgi:hypothetical protein